MLLAVRMLVGAAEVSSHTCTCIQPHASTCWRAVVLPCHPRQRRTKNPHTAAVRPSPLPSFAHIHTGGDSPNSPDVRSQVDSADPALIGPRPPLYCFSGWYDRRSYNSAQDRRCLWLGRRVLYLRWAGVCLGGRLAPRGERCSAAAASGSRSSRGCLSRCCR